MVVVEEEGKKDKDVNYGFDRYIILNGCFCNMGFGLELGLLFGQELKGFFIICVFFIMDFDERFGVMFDIVYSYMIFIYFYL